MLPTPRVLSFDFSMLACAFIGAALVACLIMGGTLVMETDGNAVGSRAPGQTLAASSEGELVFSSVPPRTLLVNNNLAADRSAPLPLGPAAPGSLWFYDTDELINTLDPAQGQEGDVLTFNGMRPSWEPPVIPKPVRFSASNFFAGSSGIFANAGSATTTLDVTSSMIQQAAPYPLWSATLNLGFFDPTTTSAEGQLVFLLTDLLPRDHELQLTVTNNFQPCVHASVSVSSTPQSAVSDDFIPSVACYIAATIPRFLVLVLDVDGAGPGSGMAVSAQIHINAPLQHAI